MDVPSHATGLRRATSDDRNQFGDWHFDAMDPAVRAFQFGEGLVEKPADPLLWPPGEVGARVVFHQAVVFPLAMGMDMITAVEPADIPIEGGADVVEFVERSDQLFERRMIKKPRQIEGKDVKNFVLAVKEAADGPLPTVTLLDQGTIGEPHGSEFRL